MVFIFVHFNSRISEDVSHHEFGILKILNNLNIWQRSPLMVQLIVISCEQLGRVLALASGIMMF